MTTFPLSSKRHPGYSVAEVDMFLELARKAFEGDPSVPLTAENIRRTAFAISRGGYSIGPVDDALERLEDAFAERERDAARSTWGETAWHDEARRRAQIIVDRLRRPSGKMFNRVSIVTLGYHRRDVERFAARIIKYFDSGRPTAISEVRTVTFREQRGGYSEAQVDSLIDNIVDVMLAVR